ncbi:O-antigen ligase family protein [Candidatus Pelagibacter ubique]|nr:O-antigen ligase family protein [Candidatus Pelagibacter ubique]
MIDNKKYHSFLFKLLFYLVAFFPLIIIFRSVSINVTTVILPILFLFYINAVKIKINDIINNHLFTYLFIFFLFILINSIFHNQDYYLILKSLGNFRYLLLAGIVFFVLEKSNKEQKKFLIYLNVTLILFVCGDIIYQYFFYKNIFGFLPGMCTEGITEQCQRFSGVFNDELIAGGYLSQIGLLFFILFYFFNQKGKNLKLDKNNIYFLGLFTVIIITGERNAVLIVILTLFFILIFQKKLRYFFLYILFLIVLIFSLGVLSNSIKDRFVKPLISLDKLNTANIYEKLKNNPWGHHYEASIELFLKKPIFGHGPKRYRIACQNTKIEKKLREQKSEYLACASNPHNYLLEFLSENGIVGAIFFLGFIFIIIYQILGIRKKNNSENLVAIAIGSLILAIVFPFKPSGSFFSTLNSVMLFYIFGFYLHYLKKIR